MNKYRVENSGLLGFFLITGGGCVQNNDFKFVENYENVKK